MRNKNRFGKCLYLLANIITSIPMVTTTSKLYASGNSVLSATYDFSNIIRVGGNHGDSWYNTWAGDGKLYATNCDGPGFGSIYFNLGINEIIGDDPNNLSGSLVNNMHDPGFPDWDYGESSNPWWKVSGFTCLREGENDVFYLSISPNGHYGDTRQTAPKITIIRSADQCRSWFPSADAGLDNPMFNRDDLGGACFIQYGQAGQASVDGADQYVYAVFTDGAMSMGDSLYLARVSRSNISNLDASQWQFFKGDINDPDAHANDSYWVNYSNDPGVMATEDLTKIIYNPKKLSMTCVNYIEQIGAYVMLEWRWPSDLIDVPNEFYTHGPTYLTTYQAPHPWGPWTQVGEICTPVYEWYLPQIVNKFTTVDPVDPNKVHLKVAVSGEWTFGTNYNLNLVTLTLSTTAGGGTVQSDKAVGFNENRTKNDEPLTGTYEGIEWGSDWRTRHNGVKFTNVLYIPGGSSGPISRTFTLPEGKVLKGFEINVVNNEYIVDNGDPGFSCTSVPEWVSSSDQGWWGDVHFAAQGSGDGFAQWVPDVPHEAAVYDVYLTWTAHPNRATDAKFYLACGNDVTGPVVINQQVAPNSGGDIWQYAGQIVYDGGDELPGVWCTDDADGYVIADAVKFVEQINIHNVTFSDGINSPITRSEVGAHATGWISGGRHITVTIECNSVRGSDAVGLCDIIYGD